MTLREIIISHPEWADLEVVIQDPNDGEYHYVPDGTGMMYEEFDDSEQIRVLVFTH